MATEEVVGAISELWRFPVKSMGGEMLREVGLTERGIRGDRAFALIDMETGRVVSAKSVKRFPGVLNCGASFVEPVRAGEKLPPVSISLPDGTMVRSDSSSVDLVLSAYFERNVSLKQSAPEDYTIDQYYPDVEGADPDGNRDVTIVSKAGSSFFASHGMAAPVPVGAFFDLYPISVLTSSTLEKLSELQPETRFDVRRFRMNIILKTSRPGFIENDWVGRSLCLGDSTRLDVESRDPRCVMTTLAQDDLPQDTNVLRTLVKHNRVQVDELGLLPCAGAYAIVGASGVIRVGDQAILK